MCGLEAMIMLDAILWASGEEAVQTGLLYEEECLYGDKFKLQEMDTAEILSLVHRAQSIISQRTCPDNILATPEKVLITRDYRILLPNLDNREISLMPLPKMLFIFFLKHPEGVCFTSLDSYSDELFGIYSRISHRLDADGMRDSIARITSLESNSFHAQKTRLSRALSRYFKDSALGEYIISCKPGGQSSIALRPAMVEWE